MRAHIWIVKLGIGKTSLCVQHWLVVAGRLGEDGDVEKSTWQIAFPSHIIIIILIIRLVPTNV